MHSIKSLWESILLYNGICVSAFVNYRSYEQAGIRMRGTMRMCVAIQGSCLMQGDCDYTGKISVLEWIRPARQALDGRIMA